MKQEKNQIIVKNWLQPKLVLIVFLVFMLVLIGQFTYLSLSKQVYGTDLKKFANNRATVTRNLIAKRGTIYDSTGQVLAINVTSYTLIAYLEPTRTTNPSKPNHVVDLERTAEALAEVLDAPYEYILSRLKTTGAYQVEFGNYGSKLTELTKIAIESLELPGISFIESSKRFYPNGSFASYLVGYAKNGKDDAIVGEMGIESKYDEILRGVNGSLTYQRDLSGYQIPDTPETRIPATDGIDVYLTLDSQIQRFLEEGVRATVEAQKPEWMITVVMDAKTGAILGSATSPSFDPNNLPSELSYQNPLVSHTFEPGSVMKTFTYLCAIETGNYVGDTTYISGSYKVSNTTVNDWRPQGWGRISYDRGYLVSSNVGSMSVAKNYLTPESMRECFKKLGFGYKTGIELSNEEKGSINYRGEIEIEWLAATYGQGISVTTVQLLQALSVIANDGVMVKPYIIQKTVDPKTGEEKVTEVVRSEPLFSKKSVDYIKDLMHGVVNIEGSTGYRYYVSGFDIMGKTGTAQIFENGKYLSGSGNYLLSFTGIYPKDNPEIIVYTAIAKPSINSSSIIAEPLKELIKSIAKYKNIFDNEITSSVSSYVMSSYMNQHIDDVVRTLEDINMEVIIIGDGNTVINQFPVKGSKIVTGDKVFLVTNGTNIEMESVIGWARNDFERYMNIINVPYTMDGYGYITEQSIPKATKIDKTTLVEVVLENKFDLDERDE